MAMGPSSGSKVAITPQRMRMRTSNVVRVFADINSSPLGVVDVNLLSRRQWLEAASLSGFRSNSSRHPIRDCLPRRRAIVPSGMVRKPKRGVHELLSDSESSTFFSLSTGMGPVALSENNVVECKILVRFLKMNLGGTDLQVKFLRGPCKYTFSFIYMAIFRGVVSCVARQLS